MAHSRFSHCNNAPKFHLWMPDIFNFKGGIQVYSGFLLNAIQSIYPNAAYDIFLKHDTDITNELSFLDKTQFHFTGRWPGSIRTASFATQLAFFALWQRPTLIITSHLHFARVAYWLKRLTGRPYWVVAHGVEAWGIEDQLQRIALQNADKILAVSSYTRSRLIAEQSLDPDRVVILPNTVNADRFQIAPKPAYLLRRYNLCKEQPIVLTVSRLVGSEQYKGYDRILEAIPLIRQMIPNVHYIIAGKGDDRPRIERIIAELKLQAHVTLAGFIPDAELCDHYNLCDLFAMPSKREGFGIVYLEALACGKPTLAGNKDGAVDALLGGELGSLVDPDNVEQIAQTIIKILQQTYPHPLLYNPEALRKKVLASFGFEQFKQTLGNYLQEHFMATVVDTLKP